jgi:hypothetical protein
MGPLVEETRRLGRIAYEACCESTGWKSAVTGQDLPPFYETPEAVQVAWMAAAHALKMPDPLFEQSLVTCHGDKRCLR